MRDVQPVCQHQSIHDRDASVHDGGARSALGAERKSSIGRVSSLKGPGSLAAGSKRGSIGDQNIPEDASSEHIPDPTTDGKMSSIVESVRNKTPTPMA